jgi:hypothetical protein
VRRWSVRAVGRPLAPLLCVAVAASMASCAGSVPSAQDGASAGTGGSGTGGIGGGASVGGSGAGGSPQIDAGIITDSSSDARGTGGAGAGGRSGLDAGGPDTGGGTAVAGGPSLCPSGRYIVCEGFESTAVGTNVAPAGWTRSGAVDVIADAGNVYRGMHAMRNNAAASGARRVTLSGAAVTALGGSHWGRVFYKVQTPAPTPASGVVHSTLVAGAATSPVSGTIEVRVVDTVEDTTGHHQFLYNVQPNGRAEFGKGSPYSWTYDGNWHCAEWHVDYATQSYHYYFDGTEITSIAIANGAGNFTNSEIPTVFSSLSVGWNNYQASSPGFVAWFDEIAMDVNRIGCGG